MQTAFEPEQGNPPRGPTNPYVRFAVSSIIYFGFVPLDTQEGLLVGRWSDGALGTLGILRTKPSTEPGLPPSKVVRYIQTTFTILFTRLFPSNIQRSIEAEYASVSYIIYQAQSPLKSHTIIVLPAR